MASEFFNRYLQFNLSSKNNEYVLILNVIVVAYTCWFFFILAIPPCLWSLVCHAIDMGTGPCVTIFQCLYMLLFQRNKISVMFWIQRLRLNRKLASFHVLNIHGVIFCTLMKLRGLRQEVFKRKNETQRNQMLCHGANQPNPTTKGDCAVDNIGPAVGHILKWDLMDAMVISKLRLRILSQCSHYAWQLI